MPSFKKALRKVWKWHVAFKVFDAGWGATKNVWLARLVCKVVTMNYLYIVFESPPKIGISTIYYDGYHNDILLGFVRIAWEGWCPFGDPEEDRHWVFPKRFWY